MRTDCEITVNGRDLDAAISHLLDELARDPFLRDCAVLIEACRRGIRLAAIIHRYLQNYSVIGTFSRFGCFSGDKVSALDLAVS